MNKSVLNTAMTGYILQIAIIVAAVLSSDAMAEAEYHKNGFAYGFVMEVDGGSAVYSLPLPYDVYATSVQENLADVLIFNSDGEVVPHELHHAEVKEGGYRTIRNVPYFPLADDSGLVRDDPSVEIETDSSGEIVALKKKSWAGESRATSYLFDLQGVGPYPVTLRLQWKTSGVGVMVPVTVESSSDLVDWKKETEFTLADLEFMGRRVRNGEVRLNRDPGRFLRMVTGPGGEFVRITGVQSATEHEQETRKRSWVSLPLRRIKEGNKVYLKAELPGVLPVDSLQLDFSHPNSLLHARIEGRSGSEPWRFRAETLFYDLREGEAQLRNRPLLIQKSNVAFFRLEVLQDGMGVQSEPALRVGYVPHNLVFIARGPSPFILAFGNGRMQTGGAGVQKTSFHTLLGDGVRKITPTVEVGDRVVLGGEQMLEKEKEQPMKNVVLWGVLLAGAFALAFTAWPILRKSKSG